MLAECRLKASAVPVVRMEAAPVDFASNGPALAKSVGGALPSGNRKFWMEFKMTRSADSGNLITMFDR